MKMFTLLFLLISFHSWAQNNLIAVAVNSPVQGTQVKIELDPPKNYTIKEVEYVLHDEDGKPIVSPEKWNTISLSSSTPKPTVIITVDQSPGDYKLHLRTIPKDGKSGKKNVMVPFTLAKVVEVPDPGEEGKKTVAGIDSDNNGIRDDVQIWINSSYPISSYSSVNQALKQHSKGYQFALENYNDKQKVIEGIHNLSEATACLVWITDVNTASALVREHTSMMLNTVARMEADIIMSGHYHGQSRPDSITDLPLSQRNKLCKFEAKKEIIK